MAAMETQTATQQIRCPTCNHWLADVEIGAASEMRERLRECPRCRRDGKPSHPILFARGGRVQVVCWPDRIDPARLPWPDGG
ncbi:MAG TPA: hypothetical protein VFH17_07155 [Coriobacteriia bacterium]|nr:hypothetical protein [Coriobacteriia bacterium]